MDDENADALKKARCRCNILDRSTDMIDGGQFEVHIRTTRSIDLYLWM
jgi:hypothetical protein